MPQVFVVVLLMLTLQGWNRASTMHGTGTSTNHFLVRAKKNLLACFSLAFIISLLNMWYLQKTIELMQYWFLVAVHSTGRCLTH